MTHGRTSQQIREESAEKAYSPPPDSGEYPRRRLERLLFGALTARRLSLRQNVGSSRRQLSKSSPGQLRRHFTSFALPGLFNGRSLLEPDCGLGAEPLQRFKVVSENLDDLSQAVGPPRFDSPFPVAAPHYTEKGF